ncbi:DUF6817 domain-containing protein [Streptomyces sp. CC210A]|uniref:DUF6817 domain-containing protein n=1 Tax=Streptomyces sp. CC210A TaxID=2898184 RepID=UPI001F1C7A4C|nr:hypothetical protein [Streptomyces sp. CC210A]
MTDRTEAALALLERCGAADAEHPGGTLLAHLLRVRERLAAWGARPELQLAGLCHASYGTDGFPDGLLPPARRHEVRAAAGDEAEELVYFYASCDRVASSPELHRPGTPFLDRFTGESSVPSAGMRREFAELTAANELDIAAVSPEFRARWGPDLLSLPTRLGPLLSEAARQDVHRVLGRG